MNPKQIIIVSTMALVISLGSMMQGDKSSACNTLRPLDKSANLLLHDDDFHEVLGVDSDEQVYDALYSGKSLADIAAENGRDVQNVIELQLAQLMDQLDLRLASGSLTVQQYESHKAELRDIVTNSVYGRASPS